MKVPVCESNSTCCGALWRVKYGSGALYEARLSCIEQFAGTVKVALTVSPEAAWPRRSVTVVVPPRR